MDILNITISFLIFPGGFFALFFGLVLLGLDRKIVARLQRRVGPPFYQPFLDLVKLSRKEIVIANSANKPFFLLSEVLGFAGMLVAVALIPISGVFTGFSDFSDMLVILYLLAFPALSLMIGGSSSSSPFGAIGYSREMVMMIAYEVTLLIVLVTISYKVGMQMGNTPTFSLSKIIEYQMTHGSFLFDYTMLPALLAFLIFIPGIIGVVPFDIAEAETEILEGPILEYSGSSLVLFNLMSALKLVVVLALAVTLFFPTSFSESSFLNLLWFVFKCFCVMLVCISILRASTGRMRVDQAFKYYLLTPLLLALISLVLTLNQI